MAKTKKPEEPKIELEREYIVPLRKGWLKVPEYKRANKAVKTLKEFLAKHMKIYDRDLRKIKIDNILNNEIRFRGMKKPPAKIKVKVKKFEDGIVRVELVDIPAHVKFEKLREEKRRAETEKKTKAKEEAKTETEKALEQTQQAQEEKPKQEESEETKEKEQASKEESLQKSKQQAKELKHTSKTKDMVTPRKTLSR